MPELLTLTMFFAALLLVAGGVEGYTWLVRLVERQREDVGYRSEGRWR